MIYIVIRSCLLYFLSVFNLHTTGYTGSPEACVDINECEGGSEATCGENYECFNTDGSYTCQCASGFDQNEFYVCVDVDECSRPDTCGDNAECVNTPGKMKISFNSGIFIN